MVGRERRQEGMEDREYLSEEEMKRAINKLKNGKAMEAGGVPGKV